MSESTTETKTQDISQQELDALLGMPGTDDIMTANEPDPEEKETKKSVLSSMNPDMSFLDKLNTKSDEKKEEEKKEETEPEKESVKEEKESIDEILDLPKEEQVEEKQTENNNVLMKAFKKQVEKGNISLFADNSDIETYSEKDIEDLLEQNLAQVQETTQKEFTEEFMNSLPFELQQACVYHFNGGKDLKSMLKVLSTTEEFKSYSTEKKEDQRAIVREFLRKKDFGTEEQIDEEITDLEDRGKLKERAEKYKPMLDEAQQKEILERNKKEEANMKKRREASAKYIDSIYDLVNSGEIDGLKLDGRTQDLIYSGLIDNNMTGKNGKPTNKFGYLLEKYQWVEPRHDLIAECFWLLADPEGYKKSVINSVKKDVTEQTVRKLKTEQQSSKGSTTLQQEERPSLSQPKRATIQRPRQGFFSWNK